MSNRSVIPAFRASVGDWQYYICVMKYAEVARSVGFAHELNANKSIDMLIQRGIGDRTEEITQYLLRSDHRFLGALIIAAYGGDPKYSTLTMERTEDFTEGMDENFGVLSFDQSQSYFALDGQHRLRAIKDAVKRDPSLGSEDICVIMVSHFDTEKGREKTRRLFTNINRNAKVTTAAENIVLDEDDGSAIITRRLLLEHPFFREEGRVKVFSKIRDDGTMKPAGKNVPPGDKLAITSIGTLYDLVKILTFGLDKTVREARQRPSPEILDESYEIVADRLISLFDQATDLKEQLQKADNARMLRAPKGHEASGHPFMRPVIQQAVVQVARDAAEQGQSWGDTISRLRDLDWKLGSAPWIAVYNTSNNKMVTAKENKKLLEDLLRLSLVPSAKARVKDARRDFKDIRGMPYPHSEDEMVSRLIEMQPEQASS